MSFCPDLGKQVGYLSWAFCCRLAASFNTEKTSNLRCEFSGSSLPVLSVLIFLENGGITLIKHLKYFHGTGYQRNTGMPGDLTIAVSVGESLMTHRIVDSYKNEQITDLDGDHGDPEAGDPVEVDVLKLETADTFLSITVFNRGIALLFGDNEEIRRLHRFFCVIEKELADAPPLSFS